MSRLKKLYTLVGAAALMVGSGCGDLEVTNPNNPDIARALASPEDVKNLALSSVRTWWNGNLLPGQSGGELAMSVTADVATANFGNFGMRFNNLEPRIPYENLSAGGDREVAEQPWYQNYAALSAANDVLRAININNLQIPGTGNTEKYKQLAQFTAAGAYMKLGLIFDKAFIIDESFNPETDPRPELSAYSAVSAEAVRRWEELAAAASATNFSYLQTEIPLRDTTTANPVDGLTSARLARIANTMAAITMAASPRDAAEAATVNWAKVAQLADKGIGVGSAGAPFNFTIDADLNNWRSYFMMYGNLRSWVRIDHRLINLMDGTTPPKFDGTVPPRGTSPDARYTSDFLYVSPPIGDPLRGIYMQSVWFHRRYVSMSWESANFGRGPTPFILAAESDLVRAEALIRSGGDRLTAAQLINRTRVNRGQLTPLTGAETDAVLFAAIDYERQVELLFTSAHDLFWARHGLTNRLQPGTWRHLPIPARELETIGLPIYTFGGSAGEK